MAGLKTNPPYKLTDARVAHSPQRAVGSLANSKSHFGLKTFLNNPFREDDIRGRMGCVPLSGYNSKEHRGVYY
jgi:hypothetical protein